MFHYPSSYGVHLKEKKNQQQQPNRASRPSWRRSFFPLNAPFVTADYTVKHTHYTKHYWKHYRKHTKRFEGCRTQVSWSCNLRQRKWILRLKGRSGGRNEPEIDSWLVLLRRSAPPQVTRPFTYRQGSQLRPKVGVRHKSCVLVLIEFVPSQRETETETETERQRAWSMSNDK